MKTYFQTLLLILVLISIPLLNSYAVTADTLNNLVKSVDNQALTINNLTLKLDTINNNIAKMVQVDTTKYKINNELIAFDYFMVSVPIVLFIIIFFVILSKLKKSKFNFADALKGDIPISIITAAPDAIVPIPDPLPIQATTYIKNGEPQFPQSSSRLIALFSGFSAIIIAVSLTSFHIYFSLKHQCSPDFKNLLEIILGLGIGVIPYAFNKWKENNNKTS